MQQRLYLDSLSKEALSQNLSVYEVRRPEDAVNALPRVCAKRFGPDHVSLLRYQRERTGRQWTLVDAAAAPDKDNEVSRRRLRMIVRRQHSLHLHNVSGPHSHASSALRRQGADPDWFTLLPGIWFFFQTGEFAG